MAAELGWDDARIADEVDHYLRRVEAERQSQLALTDQEADEARVERARRSSEARSSESAYELVDRRRAQPRRSARRPA